MVFKATILLSWAWETCANEMCFGINDAPGAGAGSIARRVDAV